MILPAKSRGQVYPFPGRAARLLSDFFHYFYSCKGWPHETYFFSFSGRCLRAAGGLRRVGYDGIISIEHEDGLMSTREGLEKAIEVLKRTIIFEERNSEMYWA